MNERLRLSLHRRYHLRMGMAGGTDRYPGSEVEEPVAIHLRHHRIRAGIRLGDEPPIPLDNLLRSGTGKLRLYLGKLIRRHNYTSL